MANEKRKLDDLTKAKLIYSGELALFAIVFLVMGFLFYFKVISHPERQIIFTWITLFGGFWSIADFVWALLSKKHRRSAPLIDKILALPVGLTVISLDLYSLITSALSYESYHLMFAIVFFYFSAVYLFESIYHFYRPLPALIEADEQSKTPQNPDEGNDKVN